MWISSGVRRVSSMATLKTWVEQAHGDAGQGVIVADPGSDVVGSGIVGGDAGAGDWCD